MQHGKALVNHLCSEILDTFWLAFAKDLSPKAGEFNLEDCIVSQILLRLVCNGLLTHKISHEGLEL